MIKLTGTLLLILITQVGVAQYYYKDLITTRQNETRWHLYKEQRVKSVKLNSFEGNGRPAEGFTGEQEVSTDGTRLTTHAKATGNAESWITASYTPQGLTNRIIDTSDTYRSESDYQRDASGHILSILNTSIETDNHLRELELHVWTYDASGKPSAMLKIKNNNDTTFIRFVQDDKGNIAEERAVRNKLELPTIFYYYDSASRLTDIVRYNPRAKRLLPDNVFEYYDGETLSSMLVVPDGSNDYLKWLYAYNDKGLKTKEVCYSRQREVLARIEYIYSFK